MRESVLESGNVSRGTLEKLAEFEGLVRHWSKRINLVSSSDLSAIWQRHILDSAQLLDLAESPHRWLDIGSGGGFPGIVVAILLAEKSPSARVALVESDKRKCAFLKTAARSLGLEAEILASRIEVIEPFGATTVSARALATLDTLVSYSHRHMVEDGVALFPKGKNWQSDLKRAKVKWSFDCDVIQSITDTAAAILRVRNIRRA